jgi:hypothetical protein
MRVFLEFVCHKKKAANTGNHEQGTAVGINPAVMCLVLIFGFDFALSVLGIELRAL